jgi:hypothetical protein
MKPLIAIRCAAVVAFIHLEYFLHAMVDKFPMARGLMPALLPEWGCGAIVQD